MIGGDQVRLTAVSLITGIVLVTMILLIITGLNNTREIVPIYFTSNNQYCHMHHNNLKLG